MMSALCFRIAAAAAAVGCAQPATAQCQPFQVLVFTKTAGFVHTAQITAGIALIQSLGNAHGFAVDQTADASLITAANLAQYSVVVFLHTTGDVLDAAQQTAFEGWVTGGGGFVGIHSAADTEYAWPFYGALLGAWFHSHPLTIQPAAVSVVDPTHPSTATLPPTFTHDEEWYNFQANVASNPLVDVLLVVDESTYSGGNMGPVHPIAWCQDSGTWRSWYTALGHTLPQYSTPMFAQHLLGGILWAAGSMRRSTVCGAQAYGAPSGAGTVVLAGLTSPPTHVTIDLSGASPGAVGMLALSTCPISVPVAGVTVLVDLASPRLLALAPIAFDALGRSQLVIPHLLHLPGHWGTSLYLQGAEIAPGLALSNGLRLSLCP
jgi:type 1 glutamine amidotransferase